MQQQRLFSALFQSAPQETGVVEKLAQEASSFPYFGPLHYFLLKEAGEKLTHYPHWAAKAALHFNNNFLLHIRLNEKESVTPSTDAATQQIQAVLQAAKANATDLEDGLLFEPLHTTDYFASQGIKLSEVVPPNDKLGHQLKSFTEWLKTIKKNGSNKLPESNVVIDSKVEEMAEKSNVETEVITEAMAEVYLSQGKVAKANEIYKKLSLQNPSKNSYFANKIK